jgi:ribose-phosphate pyrophosphokinase
MEKVRLISGRSNKPLAEGIAKNLGINLVDCVINDFANTEIDVVINENIRGSYVFIIQSGGANENQSINDYIMETLILIDACRRADAAKVNVILATFPYARSDKKDKRGTAISASLVARLLEVSGANRVISLDLHSGQAQGFHNNPMDNLYGINLHINNLRNTIFRDLTLEEINDKYVLVALDVGCSKRIKEYAKRLKMRYAVMDKQRDYSKANTVLQSVLVGNVTGKIALCVDDILDTFNTCVSAINDLKEHGASGAIVLVTHGIFSGHAAKKINECNFISKVVTINTLDQTKTQINIPKLEVIDSSPLFAEVIRRLTVGGSISSLFD